MLTFEGFEALFNQIKEGISTGTDEKTTTSNSSQNLTHIDTKQDINQRKIKTPNGMIKKPLSLAKNLTSSIVSNDMKDHSSQSSQTQNICSTTTHKNSLMHASKIIDGMKADNSQNKYEESQSTTVIKSKLKEELVMPIANIPSTAKNSKSKPVVFPK